MTLKTVSDARKVSKRDIENMKIVYLPESAYWRFVSSGYGGTLNQKEEGDSHGNKKGNLHTLACLQWLSTLSQRPIDQTWCKKQAQCNNCPSEYCQVAINWLQFTSLACAMSADSANLASTLTYRSGVSGGLVGAMTSIIVRLQQNWAF